MSVRLARRVGLVLGVVALANFAAFFVHTYAIGGDPWNGKREGGRFYVGDHGRYTEVTERRWRLAEVHTVAFLATHGLCVLVGAPLAIYARRADPDRPAVDRGL
ncbi:MAG: hypothetical protein K2X82_32985 [Gemmataceae bacterium]|nr:hypothetical protein [Gemmataceae bacterium]